jgi:hypothetical protein
MKKRGELIERSFAHTLETGGMRRTHLRFRYNIAKRMLIHVAGFNLGLLMRKRFGVGTPRGLRGRLAAVIYRLRRARRRNRRSADGPKAPATLRGAPTSTQTGSQRTWSRHEQPYLRHGLVADRGLRRFLHHVPELAG